MATATIIQRRFSVQTRIERFASRVPLQRCDVRVPGTARDIRVKFASSASEWEQAYRLAASNYQARGFEASVQEVRFTPFHLLPETVTLVAKLGAEVVATLSLIMDNTLLGLPIEAIYADEIAALRRAGCRMGEVSNFAESGLAIAEFVPVLNTLIKLSWQHHCRHGGDTAVVCCSPRHGLFYRRALGFAALGPARQYPWVQNAPGLGLVLDVETMRRRVPDSYRATFGRPLPPQVLRAPRLPVSLMTDLANRSAHVDAGQAAQLLRQLEAQGSPRRW